MFYYIKLMGDEPIILETKEDIKKGDITASAEDVYFLVTMMTPQGQGMVPINAPDQGLNDSEITIFGDTISLIAKLSDSSQITQAIKQLKLQKSGIVTPTQGKILTL